MAQNQLATGASVFVALRRDKGEASPTRLASIPQPVVRVRGKQPLKLPHHTMQKQRGFTADPSGRYYKSLALVTCNFPRFAVEAAEDLYELTSGNFVGSRSYQHCRDLDLMGSVCLDRYALGCVVKSCPTG